MIELVLSERDFDYELQTLVNSFFPGQKSTVSVCGMKEPLTREMMEQYIINKTKGSVYIGIFLGMEQIVVSFLCGEAWHLKKASVSGGDWHKHKDKLAHPYRTYYKSELKRLLYFLLKEMPESVFPKEIQKKVPVWGTMTGVRPTKIPMNELLLGKSREEVEQSLERWYCCTEEKKKLCLGIALREAELLKNIDFEEGFSLYIGIPFCPTTCLYCSFPSYPMNSFGHLAGEYLQALKKEIHAAAKQCMGRKLTSIYIGGGTPTALTAGQLDELLACICECFPIEKNFEFTVEAGRPDSISAEKLTVLRNYGVERISVNPQTMQQKTLDLIGRRHSADDAKKAFWMAREAGFTNINMDLIIGLPQETIVEFSDTLEQIQELNPDSITVHSLVVKRASALRSLLEERGDFLAEEKFRREQMEQMLALAEEFAKAEGYVPYYMYRQKNSAGHFGSSGQENIGYAREGKECLYNILIMEEVQTIVALGAGSITKRVYPDGRIERCDNVKDVAQYIERIGEMIERKRVLLSD